MAAKPPIKPFEDDQSIVPQISVDQTYRIGEVIALWSKLEAAMDALVWEFLGTGMEDGRLVTTELNANAKIQILRSLGNRHLPNETNRRHFAETMKYVGELKEARNFIVHGTWGTLKPENVPIAASLKPKTQPDEVVSETFSQERMEGIRDGIGVACDRINKLCNLLEQRRLKLEQV